MSVFGAAEPRDAASSRIARARFTRQVAAMGVIGVAVASVAFAALPATRFRASATLATGLDTPVLAALLQSPGLIKRLGASGPGGNAANAKLLAAASLTRGDAPGLVDLSISDADPVRAALVMGAAAKALTDELDARAEAAARARDLAAMHRIDDLVTAAQAAHRRLASFGAAAIDPAETAARLAQEAHDAEARLATLKGVVASGTPPLADRRDMPQTIDALQTDYLDRSHQLEKARETLGERHTTVIALVESTRRAAAALMAEWKRLQHVAEADLATARDREARNRAILGSADAAAAASARAAALAADDAVVRSQTELRKRGPEGQAIRVIASNREPQAEGFELAPRLSFAAFAGLLAALCTSLAQRLKRTVAAPQAATAQTRLPPTFFEPDFDEMPAADTAGAVEEYEDDMMFEKRAASGWNDAVRLEDGVRDVVERIRAMDVGGLTTIVVAATEATAPTAGLALAIGAAAVERGARVLLVDENGRHTKVAEAVDTASEPMLVDVQGALRVVLPAEGCDGLYLAPLYRDGSRIATALSRHDQVVFVDDVAGEFDLLLVDGGRPDATRTGLFKADAYLRIARRAIADDDIAFADALGVVEDDVLGTLTPVGFLANPPRRERPRETWRPVRAVEERPQANARASRPGAHRPVMPAPVPASRSMGRRASGR